MSRDDIDKAIYDKARFDSLRERGVDEERAKRVGTVPLEKNPTAPARPAASEPRKPLAKEIAQHQRFENDTPAPRSTPGLNAKADPSH